MLEFLKKETNSALTENGAVTYKSTYSECVDLFATIGAMRRQSDEEIIERFVNAFLEDRTIAMKILFFARDIRGGLGERRVFRTIIAWMADHEPEALRKNLEYVAEFGRYDDLLCLLDTECRYDVLRLISRQFHADMAALKEGKPISLLGKWLPSVNASNAQTVANAKMIAKFMGLRESEYRKALVALRASIRILENNLRERDYTFDYEKQPSKAMFKYRKAFERNDGKRYGEYLKAVDRGEAKMHTGTLAPYELVEPFLADWTSTRHNFLREATQAELDALNTTWNALPDYTDGRNVLVAVDTSGSMFWEHDPMPASVAISLGLYFAERNKGAFGNHFMIFSETPQLVECKGDTFSDRLRYVCSFNEIGRTNIEAVFRTVLNAAVKNGVPQSQLPEQIVIVSDMEFDRCTTNASLSNFENARKMFSEHGYKLPQLVFWNVSSRNRQQPVTMNDRGVLLVSGCTPRLFELIAGGTDSPYALMMETIGSKRYECIAA